MRLSVVPVEGALVERVFDLTYPVWHDGLSREAYARWNTAQAATPWGRDHLQRFALVDGRGRLLASAKRYRWPVRLDRRDGWMCGLAAVFTPPDRRGRGFAGALVEALLEWGRRDGALCGGLFSEIGPAYYERHGFSAVSLAEATLRVAAGRGAPAMLVRAGTEQDLPAVAAMHEPRAAAARLALRRDVPLLQYALTKKRLFAGLSAPGSWQVEFFVAEEGASAAAYAVLTINQWGWTLEEAGDRDPSGARLGALLQVLIAREPSQPPPLIRTWWPAAFPVPPQVEVADVREAGDLFMLRPLSDAELPASGDEVFYWHSDYF